MRFLLALCLLLAPIPAAAEPPAPSNLEGLALGDLLAIQAAVERELKARGVLRSGNLTGELAEHLFTTAFDWRLAEASQKGFDATDGARRFQIKARRVAMDATHHQLGALRDLDGFDELAILILERDYTIRAAALAPVDWVRRNARFNDYTNSWRLVVSEDMLRAPELTDVTEALREALRDHR